MLDLVGMCHKQIWRNLGGSKMTEAPIWRPWDFFDHRAAFAAFSWRYVYFFQMVTIGGVVAASAKGVKPYSARSVLSIL